MGDWVKQQELHSGWDEEFGSYVLDEDKVRGLVYACALHLHAAPGNSLCAVVGRGIAGWCGGLRLPAAPQGPMKRADQRESACRFAMHWKSPWKLAVALLTTMAATSSQRGE